MFKLSEILKNNNNYYCIITKHTIYLKDFFKNSFIMDDNILILKLFTEINNIYFLNMEILLLKIQDIYNSIIEDVIKNNKNNYIIVSQLPFKNVNIFIDDISNIQLKITVNNEHFINLHKLKCIFKSNRSIYLLIFQYFVFNLKDLYYFIISNNYYIEIKNYEFMDKIFKSFKEGIDFLIHDNNILKLEILNLFEEYMLKNNNKSIYDTYIYWQEYFQEDQIQYCDCLLINYKEIDEYNYLHINYLDINSYKHLYLNYSVYKSRHICIHLSEDMIVKNSKQFYMDKILKFPFNNIKKNKIKLLKSNKKTNIFDFNY